MSVEGPVKTSVGYNVNFIKDIKGKQTSPSELPRYTCFPRKWP